MNRTILTIIAGTVCPVALAQQPAAPTEQGSPPPSQTSKLFDTQISLSADHALRSDVDGGGDVSVSRAMVSAVISRMFGSDIRASLLVSNEWTWYDFNSATGLIAGTGKPFGQLMETDIAPGISYKINERWSALSGFFFRFAGENDADIGDSFTWGGYAAARYAPSEDLSFSFGVRANTRLEDSTNVLPALAVDWRVNETVRFTVSPAVGGIGFRVTSQNWEQVAVLADGVYQSRQFRLNDGPPLAEGVVNDDRFLLGVGMVWTPSPKAEITARLGMVVWQEFEINDASGNEIASQNTDPTPYVYVGGSLKF